MKLTTKQAAKLTGIPEALLMRMRIRNASVSLCSALPFHRTILPDGEVRFWYSKSEVVTWMKAMSCRITAGEAAMLLGMLHQEVMNLSNGSYPLKQGYVVVYPGQNIFVFRNNKLAKALKRKRAA